MIGTLFKEDVVSLLPSSTIALYGLMKNQEDATIQQILHYISSKKIKGSCQPSEKIPPISDRQWLLDPTRLLLTFTNPNGILHIQYSLTFL